MTWLTCALLACVLLLCAQSGQAVDVSQQVQNKYSQVETLQADFTQSTYIELLDREQTRSGKLYFGLNKFRIDYSKPEKQSYIFNGETLWIYSPKYKEVETYQRAAQRISREALSFLSGLGTLEETFQIPKVSAREGQSILTLIPRDKDSRLKKIELVVDKEDHLLQAATLWPKRGNRSHYTFSELKLGEKIADKLFNFKAPKNVTVFYPDR